jgi:hypothetical protein
MNVANVFAVVARDGTVTRLPTSEYAIDQTVASRQCAYSVQYTRRLIAFADHSANPCTR